MTDILATEAGVDALCEWLRNDMARRFLQDGELIPSIDGIVLAMCEMPRFEPGADLRPGPKLPTITPIGCPMNPTIAAAAALHGRADDEQVEKDLYAFAVRTFVRGTAAVGFVFMAEAWYLQTQGVTPPKGGPGKASHRGRWFKGQVKDQPDRREALMLSLQHKTMRQQLWRADILRDPLRLEPWERLDFEMTEGRSVDLVGKLDWS